MNTQVVVAGNWMVVTIGVTGIRGIRRRCSRQRFDVRRGMGGLAGIGDMFGSASGGVVGCQLGCSPWHGE